MLDEVEEARIGPLQVLEDEHGGGAVGDAFEEPPPGGEQLVPLESLRSVSLEECGHARLHPAALRIVADQLDERRRQLPPNELRRRIVLDPCPASHHLGERREGHAVAVGGRTSGMPGHGRGHPLQVLTELPGEAALADSGNPGDRHETAASLNDDGVEQADELAQLLLAADEGPVVRTAAASRPRRTPGDRAVGLDRLRTASNLDLADRLVAGSLAGERVRGGVDQQPTGWRVALEAGGGVDEVAGDHALADRAERDRRLPGGDRRAGGQRGARCGTREPSDGIDQRQPGPDRAVGVVLVCHRRTPHGHDRVADELLDRAAVRRDDGAGSLEVARLHGADLLGIEPLREGREADDVTEQHRHAASLRGRSLSRRRDRLAARLDRLSARGAEAQPARHRLLASAACRVERDAARAAVARGLRVREAARRADHGPIRAPRSRAPCGW